MPTSLANNRAARDAVLARVRKALGKDDRTAARADAEAYIAAHGHGPRPAMPADLVARFLRRATDMESTRRAASPIAGDIPPAVARYVDALDLPPALAAQKSHAGVCWPEFADLDWAAAGLAIEARPTTGDDRLGITGAFCAIAETGTLVVLAGRRHADGDHAAAGHAHRRRPRGSHRVGHGGGVRADPRASAARCRARST